MARIIASRSKDLSPTHNQLHSSSLQPDFGDRVSADNISPADLSEQPFSGAPPLVTRPTPKPHRAPSVRSNMNHTGVGAEPGINPRRESAFARYGSITQDSQIEVTDYSSEKSTFRKMTNKEFVDLMNDPATGTKEPWAQVRWINIGGLSWDVISAVALKYDIHSLALEDVLHEQGHNHSKVDYYQAHLFLRILCHSLAKDEQTTNISSTKTPADLRGLPRSSSPDKMTPDDYDHGHSEKGGSQKSPGIFHRHPIVPHRGDDVEGFPKQMLMNERKQRSSGLSGFRNAARERQMLKIQELKRGESINVNLAPMYICLFRSGVVISMHPTPNLEFTAPITSRLHEEDSVLRTSADASLLVESLLDLVVDRVLEVVDEYQDTIHDLENEILLKSTMHTVRRLHILSGDLILHKRTLDPIKTVIYGLRQYDLDRCIALANMSVGTYTGHSGTAGADSQEVFAGPDKKERKRVEGYMSYLSKIYLADVYDHMDFALTSVDMFAGVSENLINYAFNMASYEMNQVMRRLTLATIIFLPLTLLTGYFGMNFTRMWSINNNSDVFFWIISLPVMGIIIPIFTYSDIVQMIHYLRKRMAAQKLAKIT